MQRDDSSHTPEPHHELVGGPHHPGDALMVQSHGAPDKPLAITSSLVAPAQNVLRGGMDANTFLHALRRRWMLALGMGMVIGAGAAIALWFIFPESSSATALFEIRQEQESIIHDATQRSTQDYEILKKTQLAKLKSKFLLTTAIRDPGIASLSILASATDKEEWLQEHLDVEFPQNGEILSISLSGSPPDDLVSLVNAVAEAYNKEVIGTEKSRKLNIRDMLEKSLLNLQAEIKRKYEDYIDIAKGMGRPTGSDHDPETDLLLRDIADTQGKAETLTSGLYQLQTDYMVAKSELSDPALYEAQAEEALKVDQKYQYLQYQLNAAQIQQMSTSPSSKGTGSHGSSSDRQVQQLQHQLDLYSADFKKKMVRDTQNKPNVPLQQLTQRFRTQAGSMKQQLDMVTKQLEQKRKDLQKRVEKSVDLETSGDELKQKQQLANDMNAKLEGLDIDLEVPAQIKQVQPAVPTKNINTTQHYAIAILGGMAGFGLTCLGIAYLEFRNRQLNGPEEMDEGLGIRVVGMLPTLSSRKALDPTPPGRRSAHRFDRWRADDPDARFDVEAAPGGAGDQRRHDGRTHHGGQPAGRQLGPRRPTHAAGRRRPSPPRPARAVRRPARRRPLRSAPCRGRRGRRHSPDARRRPVVAHGRLLRCRRDPRAGDRANATGVRQAPRRIRLHHHRRCPGPRYVRCLDLRPVQRRCDPVGSSRS